MVQFIKSIRIKNFRSIVNERIRFGDESISTFVGRNDAGKSNALKALNLFFNGETDFDTAYRFDDDYSLMADRGKGKAKEIFIELLIEPPKRLRGASTVRWRKKWRRGSEPLSDEMFYIKTKKPVGSGTGVSSWLRNLKYRYVPAQKGQTYFSQLMSELHDVLNEVHSHEFESSAEEFIMNIQSISDDIASEIESLIGFQSKIQAPSDFRVLFNNLDFGENVDNKTFLLKRRGDGIRTWHIPIILKVMAKKEKDVTRPGYVKPDTIWGFEEPENNLEMSNAFKLAKQFAEFSKEIQILLTTHSPAFYGMQQSDGQPAARYFLHKGSDRITHLIDADDARIDEEMGILHLIAPHVKEANDKVQEYAEMVSELESRDLTKPVFVLSEDKNLDFLDIVLRSSGIKNFEIESYEGSGNIQGAFQMARYIRKRSEKTSIIIHRDRDYLQEKEITNLLSKAERAKCQLFITTGTDIESSFLHPEYIAYIGDISLEEAEAMIDSATQKSRELSIDIFSRSTKNISGEWSVSQFCKTYDADPAKYRHGKTVLKQIIEDYQSCYDCDLAIGPVHGSLANPELVNLVAQQPT